MPYDIPKIIRSLCGAYHDPREASDSSDYIRQHGVAFFSWGEMTTGGVPPAYIWDHAVAVALVAQAARVIVGKPQLTRDWYATSGHSPRSDHYDALAADLHYDDDAHLLAMLEHLAWMYLMRPELGLRLGVGTRTIHLSVARRGVRPRSYDCWHYRSLNGNRHLRSGVSDIFPECLDYEV